MCWHVLVLLIWLGLQNVNADTFPWPGVLSKFYLVVLRVLFRVANLGRFLREELVLAADYSSFVVVFGANWVPKVFPGAGLARNIRDPHLRLHMPRVSHVAEQVFLGVQIFLNHNFRWHTIRYFAANFHISDSVHPSVERLHLVATLLRSLAVFLRSMLAGSGFKGLNR